MERKHAEKAQRRKREVEEVKDLEPVETPAVLAEMDALLDEIDGVLVENAQEFVEQYVQQGGQ